MPSYKKTTVRSAYGKGRTAKTGGVKKKRRTVKPPSKRRKSR